MRSSLGSKPAKTSSDPLAQYREERSFENIDFEDVPKPHQPKARVHLDLKMTFLLILTHISLSFLPFLTMASGSIIQWNCRGLAAYRQLVKEQVAEGQHYWSKSIMLLSFVSKKQF